jgi:hypothetical protein
VKSRLSVGKWSDAVHYDGLQTGMEFNISGIQFNVLYTMVDLYPRTAADFEFNNTSTVLRTTVKGQRVLFLGDIMKEGCDHMTDTLSVSTFRSDIVQFSHHGYEGATKKVYDSVAAGTVLWPMNIIGNQEKGYSSIPQKVFANWYHKDSGSEGFMSNKYICTQAGYVKQVIVSGMGDYEINFPYTPSAYPETGTRLPDYNAYFEENT